MTLCWSYKWSLQSTSVTVKVSVSSISALLYWVTHSYFNELTLGFLGCVYTHLSLECTTSSELSAITNLQERLWKINLYRILAVNAASILNEWLIPTPWFHVVTVSQFVFVQVVPMSVMMVMGSVVQLRLRCKTRSICRQKLVPFTCSRNLNTLNLLNLTEQGWDYSH